MRRCRGGAKGSGRGKLLRVTRYSPFWSIFWPRSYQHQNLKAYIPFRLEEKLVPQTGPVVGVIEIDQNISGDLAEISNFRLIILITLVVIMGLLFLVLRQIVKKAGVILERRQESSAAWKRSSTSQSAWPPWRDDRRGRPRGPHPLGIISSTAELLQNGWPAMNPKTAWPRSSWKSPTASMRRSRNSWILPGPASQLRPAIWRRP